MSTVSFSPIPQRVTMSSLNAVLIAASILVPCLLVGFASPYVAKTLVLLVVFITSMWVAVDSSRLNCQKYKSQVAESPFVLFTACVGVWPVIFPAYLIARRKLLAGLLPEATTPSNRRAFWLCVTVWIVVAVISVLRAILVYVLSSPIAQHVS